MDNFTCLYSPGTNSYIQQLARNCDQVNFYENDKSYQIKHSKSQHSNFQPIVGQNYVCVKFPEIQSDIENTSVPVKIFAHIFNYAKYYLTKSGANNYDYYIDLSKFNLGQDADVEEINKVYEKMLSNNVKNIFAFGVSRGSCALINWIHKYKPTQLKGIILEGTPSSLMDVLNHSKNIHYCYYKLVSTFIHHVSSYDHSGPHAIDNILSLPKNIPILLITSKNDTTVPSACSQYIFNILKDNDYDNVKLLILNKPDHNHYISHNNIDTKLYIDAVDEFYSKMQLLPYFFKS